MSLLPDGWGVDGGRPLEVDFGCHRGAFFIGMAALHGGVDFLGIEKQPHRVGKCNARIARMGLTNAHAVQGFGGGALEELPAGSVSVFHLYFPDPWPKRRHADRRIFQPAFVEGVRRVLRSGGVLRVMTDDQPYFRDIEAVVADGDWLPVDWDDGRETVETAFEKTFRVLGKPVGRLALAKP